MCDRRTAPERITDFVAAAKRKPHARFTFKRWDDPVWGLKGTEALCYNFNRSVNFLVTELDEAGRPRQRPFEEPFASFARAMCNRWAKERLELDSYNATLALAGALGVLEQQLPEGGKDPTRLLGEHFSAAVQHLIALDYAPSYIAVFAHKLDWVATAMDNLKLTEAPIAWVRTYFHDPESDLSPDAIERKRTLKLLCEEDVILWAQLSNDPGPNPFDRLRQRVVDLMMCGCFRINEVLSMPYDALVCEPKLDADLNLVVDEAGEAVQRYGLRYWPSKNHGGVALIKAIPTVMAPIVMRALDEIRALTKGARDSAKAFFDECSPYEDWVGLPPTAAMRQDEVGHFIGFHGSVGPFKRGRAFIERHKVPHWFEENPEEDHKARRRIWVEKSDLEATVRRISYDRCRQEHMHGTTPLHDCLFVHPKVMYRDGRGIQGSAELLGYKAIEYYLREKFPRSLVLADSLQQGEDEETALYTTTHMFRFWLNTEAFEQGISDLDVATWSGRTKLSGNRFYDLRSPKAKAEQLAKKMVAMGEDFATPIEITAAPTFDAALVAGRGGHATAAGFCHLHYAGNPCKHVVASAANGTYAAALANLTDADLDGVIARLERLIAASVLEVEDRRLGADRWVAANQRLFNLASAARAERKVEIPREAHHAEKLP